MCKIQRQLFQLQSSNMLSNDEHKHTHTDRKRERERKRTIMVLHIFREIVFNMNAHLNNNCSNVIRTSFYFDDFDLNNKTYKKVTNPKRKWFVNEKTVRGCSIINFNRITFTAFEMFGVHFCIFNWVAFRMFEACSIVQMSLKWLNTIEIFAFMSINKSVPFHISPNYIQSAIETV